MRRSCLKFNVYIRFYEELNDFLRPDYRKKELTKQLNHRTTVKDVIESFGIPHTEVDLILVNSESVDFNFHINANDRISVYPVFESFDISNITRLQERPLRNLQFIADCHLGKLVKKLRLLGLDVTFKSQINDEELLQISINEKRVLLSRDRRLLMCKQLERGYLVKSQIPSEQVEEIIKRFDLSNNLAPFTRCANCNGILEPVSKLKVFDLLEPKTKIYYEKFFQCQSCSQVYWQGSHFSKLLEFTNKMAKIQNDSAFSQAHLQKAKPKPQ